MERAADLSAGAPRWHAGSCHCGRVRIEALAPEDSAWPMLAVQWHPEYLGPEHAPSVSFFETLIRAAE